MLRDLLVDRSRIFAALEKIEAWVPVDSYYHMGSGQRQSQETQQMAYLYSKCMSCGCCLEACPQFLAVEIRQNQVLLERSHQTMLRDQELTILNATHMEVEQFNDLRAQIYLNEEISELWLSGRSGEFDNEVDEYRYNQLCSAWFIANGLSYKRSIVLGRPEVLRALPEQSRFGIDISPGMKKCWDRIMPFLVSFGFDEYVTAVENTPPRPSAN